MTIGPDRLVVDLDDQAALDTELVGAKAAWLARARRAGLPVLPGVVLVAAASAAALAAGLERLSSSGSGAARMAVTALGVPPDLIRALEETIEWERLAVRSSSPLEGSGEWAGAFATYLDVGAADLAKAVSGCWASTFTASTLGRFENSGLQPSTMAVLVQPFVEADAGGVATVVEGSVVVDSVAGSPVGLLAGRRGGRRSVLELGSGRVEGYDQAIVGQVASVALAARNATGASHIEWLEIEGQVWIVQLAAPSRPVPQTAVVLPDDPALRRVARIIRRFPGALGEKLVLPWALALDDPTALDEVEPIAGGHLAAIAELAAAQTNRVWRSSIGTELAAAALNALAGDPLSVDVSGLRPVDLQEARRIVGLIRGIPTSGHPEEVWYTQQAGGQAPLRLPPGRFEPLGAAVTEADGQRRAGLVAGTGIGFGRAAVVARLEGARLGPRQVIVAPEPIPHLAPLLWNASGLVTLSGSPAAHLFESARSLGVPAVAAADLDLGLLSTAPWAVAVNGNLGTVSLTSW